MDKVYDSIVIGGGPAGLSVSSSLKEKGLDVLLIEREDHLGGILKQCIHDGFGLTRYKERLTGPEYAYKDIKKNYDLKSEVLLKTFVLDIKKDDLFNVTITNKQGISILKSRTLVLSTGCRERTARQILINGTRPSGVFTAGQVQNLINICGLMPCKNVIILGSGDIGLIMARRLTLEGCNVIGVYEAKDKPSGLARNISQCLLDYNIPLYLSTTVTKVFGKDRLEGIEVCKVDEKLNPIKGTEKIIKCDSLVLSVGLIPENELAEKLSIDISKYTKGPIVDNNLMTSIDGCYAIGNCLSVNDLVDYVSENGFIAANGIISYLSNQEKELIDIEKGELIASIVPQKLNIKSDLSKVIFYIRSNNNYKNKKIIIKDDEKILYSRSYVTINQAESIRVEANLKDIKGNIKVEIL